MRKVLDSKSICSASCSGQAEASSYYAEPSCSQQQDVDDKCTESDGGQVQLKYVDEVRA